MDSSLEQCGVGFFCIIALDDEFVEMCPFKPKMIIRDFRYHLLELLSTLEVHFAKVPKPLASQPREVRRCCKHAEPLVCADIAGCLFPSDMLLSCL